MIFVFGSNLDGYHGGGAALYAHRALGAVWGVGEGRTGDTYALPTKGHGFSDMTLAQIEVHVARFLDHARENHDTKFALTPVGTGLAGHAKRDIWAILEKHGLPRNIYLTSTWVTK
jgi:hypothetical protein